MPDDSPPDPNSERDLTAFRSAGGLFPQIYEELRKLAVQKVSTEDAHSSLNATALVHEAFLRLSGKENDPRFENTRHLYVAASEAMRWILIDRARARSRQKRGGEWQRVEWPEGDLAADSQNDDHKLLAIHKTLKKLEEQDAETAEILKMHFFGGFTLREISDATELSYRTVRRRWDFAKAWLKVELGVQPKMVSEES